jgi:hypothetical protein
MFRIYAGHLSEPRAVTDDNVNQRWAWPMTDPYDPRERMVQEWQHSTSVSAYYIVDIFSQPPYPPMWL